MNEFSVSIVIARPLEEVWDFTSEVENIPLYSPGVESAHLTSEGPLGIGSTGVMKGRFLGRVVETTIECTDFKANERFSSKTTSGPVYIEMSWSYETVDGGTRVTQDVKGESRGFFKVAEPVVVRIYKRQCEAGLETLKELLESGADLS